MSQVNDRIAWRVQSVERCDDSDDFIVRLSAIYYGDSQDGPEPGQALVPRETQKDGDQ